MNLNEKYETLTLLKQELDKQQKIIFDIEMNIINLEKDIAYILFQ